VLDRADCRRMPLRQCRPECSSANITCSSAFAADTPDV
jgi:hypothetical protein